MSATLTRFCIEGLHNRSTIDIPIRDNKLVLVGENGTGKSTVAKFMVSFLSQEWDRLQTYDFQSITAVINGEEVSLTREDIDALHRYANTNNNYPSSSKRVVETIDNARFNVLYLPTYRRIEQDIEEVLPYIGESIREQVHSSWKKHSERVELIEFGMDDVKADFRRKMKHTHNQVNEVFSKGMNLLIGEYLRDVIQGSYEDVDPANFSLLDETTVDSILSRIEENVLPMQERDKLRDVITRIHSDQTLQERDRIIAQFWSRLITLYQKQQEIEKDVRAFVTVCNTYLSGKQISYNNVDFTIKIRQTDSGYVQNTNGSEEHDTSGCIDLKMLSSGEKQIVSLFSRLYLSEESHYFIIIDEPELSLSVEWQEQFLPHILNSEKCSGLVAVTHSPFIFNNELKIYADGIEQWTRPVGSLSSIMVSS